MRDCSRLLLAGCGVVQRGNVGFSVLVSHLANHFETMKNNSLESFWNQQAAWSQATFGLDSERGPSGPLKHLAKEAIEAQKNPTDIMEYVDCLFLVFDSARRAGFTYAEIRDSAFQKLEINQKRKWQTPSKSDEAVEHVRD